MDESQEVKVNWHGPHEEVPLPILCPTLLWHPVAPGGGSFRSDTFGVFFSFVPVVVLFVKFCTWLVIKVMVTQTAQGLGRHTSHLDTALL